MSRSLTFLPAVLLAVSPAALAAGDYVGLLRPAARSLAIAIPDPGFYWPRDTPFSRSLLVDRPTEGFKLKLGYRYSRYLSVETGYADAGPGTPGSPFASAPARGRGFSMDTVGTLPLWTHASLYGRFGAWRSAGGVSLLSGAEGSHRAGAGLRYGLGFKYDVTRRIGLQAELERFSPLDRWGPRESDTDQFTVGVTWRF